ncbi:MAG: SLOG family protein [Oscillospiraceae bacterium]|nr:SLOG family protein [Oscillospiraceae bacterium]MDE7279038.1 SLOG family protein [Oscillospiraceae bacterium]
MKTVFFTGHRKIENDKETIQKLMATLRKLMSEGASDFYAGGALGWDMLCEEAVIVFRENLAPHIKLHLILPCPPEEQIAHWSAFDKEVYRKIFEAADSVEVLSERYTNDCMKNRNARLAELGDVCVCYYDENRRRSGTAQTVRMAEKLGKGILNMK